MFYCWKGSIFTGTVITCGLLLFAVVHYKIRLLSLYCIFFFRILGRHVSVRIRQQFPLVSPGGDLGCRSCSKHNTKPSWCIIQSWLLQTHPTWLSAAQHQPRVAPLGLQRTLWPQGSPRWPVCGQGRPGPPVCCGSNSSGCLLGANISCDPSAEARGQWTVA